MKVRTTIIVLVSIFILGGVEAVFANGVKNITTQSGQAWALGGARFAETRDADTPLHNIAGTAMMDDGWHFHLSALYIPQKTSFKHTATGDEYTLKSQSLPPYAAATYKKNNWAGFFKFSLPGGIAAGELNRFPAFDAQARAFSAILRTPVTAENQDFSTKGGVYAFTLGGAYRINNHISVGYGLRRVTHFENTEGRTDFIIAATGTRAANTIVDYEIDGTGFGHSFGLDIKVDERLNFGFRYDTEVSIDVDAAVSGSDNSGLVVNGARYDEDLPAVFNAGVQYKLSEVLTLDGVFNYYFQKGVNMLGGTAVTDGWEDAYDLGLALTYQLNKDIRIGTGINYTDVGIPNDKYTLKNAMATADSFKIGVTLEYSGFAGFKITTGLGANFYTDENTLGEPLGNFERKSDYSGAIGLCIEYKL